MSRKSTEQQTPTPDKALAHDQRNHGGYDGPADMILPPQIEHAATVCTSLDDLLFSDFIRCSCDQEYQLLIRTGAPAPGQLVDAWVSLVSEYHILTRSSDAKKHATLAAKVEALNLKINTVSALVEGTRMGVATEMEVYQPFIEQLRNWGYSLPFTAESLAGDLTRVINKLGNDKTQLALVRKEAENESKGDKAMKDSYIKALLDISRHRQMHYRADKITAYEFALMYNDLAEYSQLNSKKQ